MKNLFKLIAITISTIILWNCSDDFLDEQPDNRIQINDLNKAEETLVNAYSYATLAFLEQMTDNVTNHEGNDISQMQEDKFKWNEIKDLDNDTPAWYWYGNYNAIAHANAVLEVIDNLTGDDARKNAIKGEALMCRAYAHFMLANVFGPNYTEANKSTKVIPFVTKLEDKIGISYERNTLEEIYNLVEKDMLEALKLIDNSIYSGSKKYHFTKEAGLAFASRFYLWKGDYQQCIDYSNQLLGSGTTNPKYIRDYANIVTGSSSGPKGIGTIYIDPTDEANLLLIRKETSVSLRFYTDYRFDFPTLNEIYYGSGIPRRYDNRGKTLYYGNSARTAIYFAKNLEYFRKSSPTSDTGWPYRIDPELRGEEVVFNRMEANIQLGNYAAALADMRIFISKRYLYPLNRFEVFVRNYSLLTGETWDTSNTNAILADMVQKERRIEFCQEGLRWFDIKRFGIEVVHGDDVLTATDSRKVIPIPYVANKSLGISSSSANSTNYGKVEIEDTEDNLIE